MSTPIPEKETGRKPKLFERRMRNAECGKTEGSNITAFAQRRLIPVGCAGLSFFTANGTPRTWRIDWRQRRKGRPQIA